MLAITQAHRTRDCKIQGKQYFGKTGVPYRLGTVEVNLMARVIGDLVGLSGNYSRLTSPIQHLQLGNNRTQQQVGMPNRGALWEKGGHS